MVYRPSKQLVGVQGGSLHEQSGWLTLWQLLLLWLSVAGLLLSYLQQRRCFLDDLSCSILNRFTHCCKGCMSWHWCYWACSIEFLLRCVRSAPGA